MLATHLVVMDTYTICLHTPKPTEKLETKPSKQAKFAETFNTKGGSKRVLESYTWKLTSMKTFTSICDNDHQIIPCAYIYFENNEHICM